MVPYVLRIIPVSKDSEVGLVAGAFNFENASNGMFYLHDTRCAHINDEYLCQGFFIVEVAVIIYAEIDRVLLPLQRNRRRFKFYISIVCAKLVIVFQFKVIVC